MVSSAPEGLWDRVRVDQFLSYLGALSWSFLWPFLLTYLTRFRGHFCGDFCEQIWRDILKIFSPRSKIMSKLTQYNSLFFRGDDSAVVSIWSQNQWKTIFEYFSIDFATKWIFFFWNPFGRKINGKLFLNIFPLILRPNGFRFFHWYDGVFVQTVSSKK